MKGKLRLDTGRWQDLCDRSGWWVLRRQPGGPWLVVQHCRTRARADEVWLSSFGCGDERLLAHQPQNRPPAVLRHTTNA